MINDENDKISPLFCTDVHVYGIQQWFKDLSLID